MSFSKSYKQRAIELRKENTVKRTLQLLAKEYPTIHHPNEKTLWIWCRDARVRKAQKKAKQIDQKGLEEHRAHLLEIIDMLLANDIKHVIVVDKGETIEDSFGVASPESGYYEIQRNQLVRKIEANIDAICYKFGSSDMFDCFREHLMAEYPPEQDYYELLNEYPGKLIYTLMVLARSKNFKGSCDTCKRILLGGQ